MNDTDGKPGLRIETAASVVARDFVQQHLMTFQHALRNDRASGQATSAVFIDALAGVSALVIAGGHGSKEDVIYNTVRAFKDALERDLKHLRAN